ncbi:MAG: hypothetical protein IPM71_11750 [Bacteroidota bacterium]|nr:MAG: hypothetical protein IPM71_11750 [Bacteroidota bacterium]
MKFSLLIWLLVCSSLAFAQGELDDQDKIFYRNEKTYAFLLNSNGIGGNYRYAKRIDAFRKTLYEIEFNYLKHPKEAKISTYNNRNIVYGKLNAVYTLKGAIGFQNEMFQKRDQGGISIRFFYNFGPSLAILKPIYYEYIINDEVVYDVFQLHTSPNIIGKAPFVYGIENLKVQPGIFGKIGYTFEYSKLDDVFHALELGLAFDAYIGKVPIMETESNKLLFVLPDDQFYLTLFISYRFGKVISTPYEQKKTKIDQMLAE